MKHFVCLVCLTACAVDEPSAVPDLTSRVNVYDVGPYGPPRLDMLFVIDPSSAMGPYQDRMATLPSIIEQTYVASGGILDMHIAVTSDGELRRVPAVGGSFVTITTEFDLTRTTNTTGTFLESLVPLTAVGAASNAPYEPLASVERIITENPDGFLREHAPLAIVIISASDDASVRSPADYALLAKTSKPDPANVIVMGLTAGPSPRLDAFFASFPNRAFTAGLADGDYLAVLKNIAQTIRTILPGTCFHASDIDPETPGPQYDCTVTATIRDAPRLLPPCRLADDQFCWSLEDSSNECFGGIAPLKPRLPPYHFFWFVPAVHMECVVTD